MLIRNEFAAFGYQAGERPRPDKRPGLSVPVSVYGKDVSAGPFHELTRTLSINGHGALLALAATVQEGQSILIENMNTRDEQECRVVYVALALNGKLSMGIEFTHAAVGF